MTTQETQLDFTAKQFGKPEFWEAFALGTLNPSERPTPADAGRFVAHLLRTAESDAAKLDSALRRADSAESRLNDLLATLRQISR